MDCGLSTKLTTFGILLQKNVLNVIETCYIARADVNDFSHDSSCSRFRRYLISSTKFVKCLVSIISPKSL